MGYPSEPTTTLLKCFDIEKEKENAYAVVMPQCRVHCKSFSSRHTAYVTTLVTFKDLLFLCVCCLTTSQHTTCMITLVTLKDHLLYVCCITSCNTHITISSSAYTGCWKPYSRAYAYAP